MAPRFDHQGHYLVVPPGGGEPVPHTRATTHASTNDDRYGLEKWGKRTVALGLARRPDLLAGVAAARDDDRSRLDALCDDALEAGGSSTGRNIGQALHEFCERVDLGEDVKVPETWKADIEAYRAVLAEGGFEIEAVEKTVVVPELTVAGTFDRLISRAGRRYVADIKTGQSLQYGWPAIAIQLALYSRASTVYDFETEKHSPMPDVDQTLGIVVHVPAGNGTAELIGVDLNVGWDGALLAQAVRTWRRTLFRIGLADDVATHRARLTARIKYLVAEHPDVAAELATRWPKDVPTLKSSDAHTPLELDAITVVLHQIEAAARLPFG
jgi:hypothetical protein